MIPSQQALIDQGTKDSRPLYDIEEEDLKLSPHSTLTNQINKATTDTKTLSLNIKEEDIGRYDHSPLITQPIENELTLLPPLKAPKSYGTYSKQQQEDVIAFIKDGHSLRTAEKVFGIPKSTMHCWLKKLHVKSDLSNNMKLDSNFTEPTVERGYQYSTDTSYFEEAESKSKSWKEKRVQRKVSPPASPIVIEESELIRFLQSSEGIEMIGKAYSIRVSDFLDFVDNSKDIYEPGLIQQDKSNLGIYKDNKYYQQVSPNTARKRNLHNNEYFNFDKTSYPGVALQKKIKVEQSLSENVENKDHSDTKNKTYKIRKKIGKGNNEENKKNDNNNNNSVGNNQNKGNSNAKCAEPQSHNVSLNTLSKDVKNKSESNMLMGLDDTSPSKKVLVPKPYSANKMVSFPQQKSGSNLLATRPLQINKASSQNTSGRGETIQTINQSLSPPFGYHNMTNPVSIKAETLDSEIGLPYNVSPNSGDGMYYARALSPVLPTITKPVLTLNNNSARNMNEIPRAQRSLNLNEINRTQSEKELMAMVDGDNLSADELCAEFKETLELNKWVDNETWYMDQYLQHFQVSPALTSPDSSLADGDSDDPDEELNAGLTFAVKDREKGKKKNVNQFEGTNKLSPVTVKIYEPNKSTGEVWSTLSSPGQLSTSPHAPDGLLTSPRIYDGLLCSPPYHGGSPRESLQDAGLDPNLIQPHFTSTLINN